MLESAETDGATEANDVPGVVFHAAGGRVADLPGLGVKFSKVGAGATAFRTAEARDDQGRLLAPNGKPSKLNERQWHQVRSPEFKRWFGNWAYDPTMPVKVTKITGSEIGEGPLSAGRIREWILREQRWQDLPPVINAHTGNPIGFTVQGTRNSLKRRGDEHRKAYAGLRDLLENAVFVDFEPVRDTKLNEEYLDGYEVYYGALEIDGALYGVRIKVELPNAKAERIRAYKDHKIIDVEVRSPAASQGLGGKPVGYPTKAGPTQAGGSTISLGDLAGESNAPVASKVIDENGEPLVVFHGTDGDFSAFDLTLVGHNFPASKAGFYFTNRPKRAGIYADGLRNAVEDWRPSSPFVQPVRDAANIMPVHLSLKNPKIVNVDTFSPEEFLENRQELSVDHRAGPR